MGVICQYAEGDFVKGDKDVIISEIVIDSREVSSNSLFIPIIGERFDGHQFLEGAYDNGCRSFVIDKNHDFGKDDVNLIRVDDTTKAFGLISKGYKNQFNIPFIAITGSVGKTSTKDIIYSVLSQKYNTLKTEGNLNNSIGLPKTLLKLNFKHEIGIVEMGMDKKGEISYLTNLVNPDVAVITNIGMSHIMNFENQEGIFKAKMEIVNGLKSNGLLIVNGDDKFLGELKKKKSDYELLTYGFNPDNDIYCKDYVIGDSSTRFTCVYKDKEYKFEIASVAKHNIYNAMIAILIGFRYDLDVTEINSGLLNLKVTGKRLDIFKTDKYRIIDDTYNASYDSVMSALEVLNNFEGRKVAILGDILELGDYSKEIHQKIGENINCDVVISIGDYAKYIDEEATKRGLESYYFLTKEDFFNNLPVILLQGDNILIKASRGMQFDEIVDFLKNC